MNYSLKMSVHLNQFIAQNAIKIKNICTRVCQKNSMVNLCGYVVAKKKVFHYLQISKIPADFQRTIKFSGQRAPLF